MRNTLPYNVSQKFADYDFIIESNELINQTTSIESVTRGNVDFVDIISSGNEYKVNDTLKFDETSSGGYGIYAKVSEISGKEIQNITTTQIDYNQSLIIRENFEKLKVIIKPFHDLVIGNNVTISGFSTSLFLLNNFYKIGVTTYSSPLLKDIENAATTGIVTNIALK